MSGMIHLYCGDGKGKTTAAVGLAIRAAGGGYPVRFVQFLKSGDSSEIEILSRISDISVDYVRKPFGFTWTLTEEEKQQLTEENDRLFQRSAGGDKEGKMLLVLDELTDVYGLGLIGKDAVKELLACHGEWEIVLTGHMAAPELIEAADYYTEMKAKKHPYSKGLPARKGVEY